MSSHLLHRINTLNLRLPKRFRKCRHGMRFPFKNALSRFTFATSWTGEYEAVFHYGRGAGYIGGWKAYVGFGSFGTNGNPRQHVGFATGITRNGNTGILVSH